MLPLWKKIPQCLAERGARRSLLGHHSSGTVADCYADKVTDCQHKSWGDSLVPMILSSDCHQPLPYVDNHSPPRPHSIFLFKEHCAMAMRLMDDLIDLEMENDLIMAKIADRG